MARSKIKITCGNQELTVTPEAIKVAMIDHSKLEARLVVEDLGLVVLTFEQPFIGNFNALVADLAASL